MATRRSTRVTQVDPWILGGEGQLRDLLPLPPWLFLVGRFLSQSARHWLITLTLIVALYLWIAQDFVWYFTFIIFPLIVLIFRTLIITAYLWYKNPTIPLIARKPPQ